MGCGAAAARRADECEREAAAAHAEVHAWSEEVQRSEQASRAELRASHVELQQAREEHQRWRLDTEQHSALRLAAAETEAAEAKSRAEFTLAVSADAREAAASERQQWERDAEAKSAAIVHLQSELEKAVQQRTEVEGSVEAVTVELSSFKHTVRLEQQDASSRYIGLESEQSQVQCRAEESAHEVARLSEFLLSARSEHEEVVRQLSLVTQELQRCRAQVTEVSEQEESVAATHHGTLHQLWTERLAKQSVDTHVNALQNELVSAQEKCAQALERARDARAEQDAAFHDRDRAYRQRDEAIEQREQSLKELEDAMERRQRAMAVELAERDAQTEHLKTELEHERRRVVSGDVRIADMRRCLESERIRTAELQQAVSLCAKSGAVRAMAAYRQCMVDRR